MAKFDLKSSVDGTAKVPFANPNCDHIAYWIAAPTSGAVHPAPCKKAARYIRCCIRGCELVDAAYNIEPGQSVRDQTTDFRWRRVDTHEVIF